MTAISDLLNINSDNLPFSTTYPITIVHCTAVGKYFDFFFLSFSTLLCKDNPGCELTICEASLDKGLGLIGLDLLKVIIFKKIKTYSSVVLNNSVGRNICEIY